MEKGMILSLNIIVAAGEEIELEKCLESCKGKLFDEICITIAAPEMDENVKKVAEKYTSNITFFKWIKDFSAARNFNFSQSHCSHILWLDADDGITTDSYNKLLILKQTLTSYDVVLIQYNYSHDERGIPIIVLPRERIVKNCEYIKWHDRVHEYLDMNQDFNMKKEDQIFIEHWRTKPFDVERNLDILKEEYNKSGCSPRTKFYYGKELADSGKWEEAIPVLEDCINSGEGFKDNLVIASIKLSRYYYVKRNHEAAKMIALKGISYSNGYAENYVMLGDIYWDQRDIETAIRYYKEAMTKVLGSTGMSQIAEYYKFIPCWRLAHIYFELRDYEKSLRYCDAALEVKPNRREVKELRSAVLRCSSNTNINVVLDGEIKKSFKELSNKLNLNVEFEDNNVEFARMRLTKNKVAKVAWLLPGLNLNDPSCRIRRYNVSNRLKSMGMVSVLVDNYRGRNIYEIRNMVEDAEVIIFTMFGYEELELMKYFKSLGKKIAYDFNEALFGYPLQRECFNACDIIVCCSTVLAEMVVRNGHRPVCIIRDAVEDLPNEHNVIYENRCDRPKAVYAGMGGNSFLVTEHLKDTIKKAGYDLITITEWDNATIKWDLNTWHKNMLDCDVVLCPQRVNVQPAKSNVKVTTAMSLGLPVIASPIQAYKEIISHGENGFLCDTQEEWYEALIRLKDPIIRKQIGTAGKSALKAYSLDKIARDWCIVVDNLISGSIDAMDKKVKVSEEKDTSVVKSREQVDLIIPNYNNVEYLKLCISSILMNTQYPFHLIISDAGSDENTWEYLRTLKGITVLGKCGERKNFSQACNAGIEISRSKYFVIMNSDLIVSKCWLTSMVEKMERVNRLAACGVLSNCDRGWLFNCKDKPIYPMRLEKAGIELVPGMKYDQIKPHIDELGLFMQESNKRYKDQFIEQPWVAAYCTMFARSAIEEVGYFDVSFKNGCEDLDLCRRLRQFDYNIGQAIDAFIFHFGGISRGAYEKENNESYKIEDQENHQMLKAKWSKKKIFIWCGPAWEPWNKSQVDKGMAGSETWATYLGESFTKKGYDVTIYNDLLVEDKNDAVLEPVEGSSDTVKYRHYSKLDEDVKYVYVDYFISSRSVAPFKNRLHTHHHYVMIHDVFLHPDPNFDIMMWKVEKYAYLSEWHKHFLMKHHKIPENKLMLTANGENFKNYEDVDTYTKKNQAVYSSSLDRGLYELLLILPKIREAIPDFKLIVAYGIYNWEEMCKKRKDEKGLQEIEKIKKAMEQPGVEYVGRLDKKTLANYQKESKVWLFPTWFSETQCCVPGTKIPTDVGLKCIEDIKVGDRVYTHRGNYNSVSTVMHKLVNEYIYEVKVAYLKDSLKITGEHPMYLIKNKFNKCSRIYHAQCTKNGDRCKVGFCYYNKNGIKRYIKDSCKRLSDVRIPEWVEVKEACLKDFIAIPVNNASENPKKLSSYVVSDILVGESLCTDRTKRGKPNKIKDFFIDKNFLELCGRYVSEGSYDSSSNICFSLNSEETKEADFIEFQLKKLGLNTWRYKAKDTKSLCVFASSVIMGRFFSDNFGLGAHNKKIPEWLKSLDMRYLKYFLRGVLEGDGSKNRGCVVIESASEGLISDLFDIFLKFKCISSLSNFEKPKLYKLNGVIKRDPSKKLKGYRLSCSMSQNVELFNFMKFKAIPAKKSSIHGFFDQGYVYLPIRKICKKVYTGNVYNIEVCNDNSYIANGVTVHNCITAITAGLAKTAILTSKYAGLISTVGDAGILIEGNSRSKEYLDKFTEEAIKLLKDDGYRLSWVEKAHKKMKEYSWDKIADSWIAQFNS